MINALNLTKNLSRLYHTSKLNLVVRLLAKSSSQKSGTSNKKQSYPTTQSQSDKQGLKSKHGVIINEQRIKAKMKQIKERGQVKFEDERKKKKEQFMKNYEINRGSSKIRKFRKDTDTQNLMNIEDVSLDQKPTVLQVTSYSNKEIEVDGFPYPPSVVLSNNQVFVWELRQPQKITVDHLRLVQMINPPPEYVIIGCTNPLSVPQEIQKYLSGLGINYDIIEMFEAVSNFNIYASNDVRVLAYLITTKQNKQM